MMPYANILKLQLVNGTAVDLTADKSKSLTLPMHDSSLSTTKYV
jgi:hypothetical protein